MTSASRALFSTPPYSGVDHLTLEYCDTEGVSQHLVNSLATAEILEGGREGVREEDTKITVLPTSEPWHTAIHGSGQPTVIKKV
jgi:hypothetical protein